MLTRKSNLSTPILSILTLLLMLSSFTVSSQPNLIPAPPQVAASSYILMDAASGKVIVESNSDEQLPPASLTKMMTAYIVEYEAERGNISLSDSVLISVNAWKTGGSKMFIKEGTQVALEDLLRGIIIQSGNDASVAVAEHIAGSESAFADIMNQHAKLLGMQNSHFENATGLPHENHFASARDLAKLAKAIITEFPDQYSIYSEKYFTYNDIRQPNRNRLLWRDKSVDGLKTGHTDAAGYCLVSSAVRDGMRLISVVMGTKSEEARARETQKLLNYGFRYYESLPLYSSGVKLIDSQVWGGQLDKTDLGVASDVTLTIPKGQKEALVVSVDVDSVIKAPLNIGDVLGRVKVSYEGEILADQPLIALQQVEEAGFFKRIWDLIKLFFVQLFS
ncbi:MAG: D-alanyl-D-alanine carboxypeptidase [Pseudomonadales bacterium]|uniref:serine-type D-Ala-D-Ala carboxypeptidase n=2 Tax=Oleiphilus messinensis TaxID=141451 RepID=A0A1Y0IC87_9GAMM|nr:D-alanyl-D-alanine carboxypeptidase [Oleiphilus messinensis]MCG8609181.1 D-alanyl-D-alanine carboxypeptidase [Pseudomonadales bacterium]